MPPTSGASSNNATLLFFGFLLFPLRCYSYDERSPAWLLSGEFFLCSLCCIARCSPPRGTNDSTTARFCFLLFILLLFLHPLRLVSVLPCFPFSFFFNCVSYVCIYYFFAKFSVARVSHDEAKLCTVGSAPQTRYGWHPREQGGGKVAIEEKTRLTKQEGDGRHGITGDQNNCVVGRTSVYYATPTTNCCGCPEDVFVVLRFCCPFLSPLVVLCFFST